ncbi:MAG: ChbG/HpnK family deacetylase [Myxococcaceae bacterium]
MATRLVINADDFGLHPDIDAGIVSARTQGVLTSATLLVTGRSAPSAVQQAKASGLGLGVHLAFCGGLPAAAAPHSVPSLAPRGILRSAWHHVLRAVLLGRIPASEFEAEAQAQLQRAAELGFTPDHLDSHQHLHLLPAIRKVVEQVALAAGLPLRWPSPWPAAMRWRLGSVGAAKAIGVAVLARTAPTSGVRRVTAFGLAESGHLDENALLALIDRLPSGDVEIFCHPGLGRPQVPEEPGWIYGWETELQALTSPRVKARLEASGITMCRYAAFADDARAT